MEKIVSKDGTAIAFKKSGKGPPLIMVDGAFCSSSFGPMPKLSPYLESNFTVYCYDRRGRGQSDHNQVYSFDHEIDDLDMLIRKAEEPVHLFGMSSGAALALLAVSRGLNVKKLAVYEPPYVVDKTGRLPPRDMLTHLVELLSSNKRSEAARYYLVNVMGMPSIAYYFMRMMPMWKKIKEIARSLPYDAVVMGDFSLPVAEISKISIPTLVIGGEKSPEQLRNSVKAVAGSLPGSQLVMLKDQTHNVSVKVLGPLLNTYFADEH